MELSKEKCLYFRIPRNGRKYSAVKPFQSYHTPSSDPNSTTSFPTELLHTTLASCLIQSTSDLLYSLLTNAKPASTKLFPWYGICMCKWLICVAPSYRPPTQISHHMLVFVLTWKWHTCTENSDYFLRSYTCIILLLVL